MAIGCGDNTIRLWDVATRQEVCELRGHEAYVHAVAFSPDGTRLASASGDSTVRIWDTVLTIRAGPSNRLPTPQPRGRVSRRLIDRRKSLLLKLGLESTPVLPQSCKETARKNPATLDYKSRRFYHYRKVLIAEVPRITLCMHASRVILASPTQFHEPS